jgi:hypothetical protein
VDIKLFLLLFVFVSAVAGVGIVLVMAYLAQRSPLETVHDLWYTYFSRSDHLPKGGDENRRLDPPEKPKPPEA